MKILHIIPTITAKSGGPVTTMSHITDVWKMGGHQLEVLTIAWEGATSLKGIKIHQMPVSFPARFSNSHAAIQWLTEHHADYDLFFIHSIWTVLNVRAALLLRRLKRPYVMIPHGSLDPFDLQKKSLAKRILGPWFIRPALASAATVLCSSPREADCLVTYGAKCKAVSVPWPVPPVPATMDRAQARQKLGLADDAFVVLSFGRVDYKKGFPVLLPAMKKLVQEVPKARLLVVGPDSNGYLAEVHRMVEELGLQKSVTFIPTVVGEDKLRVLRAADCYALPSLNENFGNTVVEAIQQGLPCVISNNVYICDDIERGGAGFVCRYDAQEVFESLKKLAENTGLRSQMSSAAYRTAKFYDPENLKERYLGILDTIVGKSK